MENQLKGADPWTRVDPVFNEGTSVQGRVALQLQVMSDRVARVCLATALLPPRLLPMRGGSRQQDVSYCSTYTG